MPGSEKWGNAKMVFKGKKDVSKKTVTQTSSKNRDLEYINTSGQSQEPPKVQANHHQPQG